MTGSGPPSLDIAGNRRARKWSGSELVGRGLWEGLGFLFAWSPRQAWGWRRWMLRMFGARIGAQVRVHPSVRIAVPWNLDIADNSAIGDYAILYSLGRISIGPDVTISQYAHLCAGSHDHRRSDLPLIKAEITVGRGVWICADAYVGPDVTVGDFAIVAARAVAVSDVAAWSMVGGNPARFIAERPRLAPP